MYSSQQIQAKNQASINPDDTLSRSTPKRGSKTAS